MPQDTSFSSDSTCYLGYQRERSIVNCPSETFYGRFIVILRFDKPALLSDCKEMLINLVSRSYTKPMKWENAREAGLFLWIRQDEVLVGELFTHVLNAREIPWKHSPEISMLRGRNAIP